MEVQRNCPTGKTERCIRPFVLIVEMNAKSHSNQTQADRSIAEIVGRKEDHQEEGDIS